MPTSSRSGKPRNRARPWRPSRPASSLDAPPNPGTSPEPRLCLASSDSDYMTGQVVMIDGGMVLV